jgi:hypothetical protein
MAELGQVIISGQASFHKQVMCRPKTSLSAFMPFMQLPNELLISIATILALNEYHEHKECKNLLALSSVCTHLRSLYVATPALWRRINTEWGTHMIKLFATRASPLPLHFSILNTEVGTAKIALPYMARIESLDVHLLLPEDMGEDEDSGSVEYLMAIPNFINTLNSEGAPCLRMLKLNDESDAERGFVEQAMHPPSSTLLTTLTLRNIIIEDPPALPVLRELNMVNCHIRPRVFHQFLSRVPLLDRFVSRSSIGRGFSGYSRGLDATFARLQFSALRDAVVEDDLDSVLGVIAILPNPSRTLVIHSDLSPFEIHRLTGPLESITAPFRQVWDRVAGPVQRFPAWKLGRARKDLQSCVCHSFIFINSLPSHGRPSISFRLPLMTHEFYPWRDPLWNEVRIAHLDYSARYPGMDLIKTPRAEHDIRNFDSVEELVIEHGRFDTAMDEEGIAMLVGWIIARHKQGTPIRAMEFRDCPRETAMPLVERLKATGVAPPMKWVE